MKNKKLITGLMTLTLAMVTVVPSATSVHAEGKLDTQSGYVQEKYSSSAKKVARHTVFSQKQVNQRIKKIREYYYQKPEQLHVRKRSIWLNSDHINMEYYVHGKDLMFGYGTCGKTEYRLYFYKNQLIQMLVDQPGKSRKTYDQLYKKLLTGPYDDKLDKYLMMENYGIDEVTKKASKKNKIITNQWVIITRMSKNTIEYHKIYGYGGDGYWQSMDPKVYKAKVSKDVIVLDGTDSPYDSKKRNRKWLKAQMVGDGLGIDVILYTKGNGGKVTKIIIPYMA